MDQQPHGAIPFFPKPRLSMKNVLYLCEKYGLPIPETPEDWRAVAASFERLPFDLETDEDCDDSKS